MLVMLCTRCQQREAVLQGLAPEARAKAEVKLDAFTKAAGAKTRVLIEQDLRETALRVLDFADRLVGKM